MVLIPIAAHHLSRAHTELYGDNILALVYPSVRGHLFVFYRISVNTVSCLDMLYKSAVQNRPKSDLWSV